MADDKVGSGLGLSEVARYGESVVTMNQYQKERFVQRMIRAMFNTLAGKKIALFNLDGTFFAIDDTCTHRGGPLSEGEVSGEEVTCPWHGAVYNIKTGAVLGPPAPRGVASYAVRVQGSDVEVEV